MRGNYLVDLYDRKCKRLSDELASERHHLDEEEEKSSTLSSFLGLLEEKVSEFEVIK